MTGRLWTHADFRKLWFGQTLSSFGSKISTIAVPTLAILTLHATPFDVGLLAAFGLLPYLVLSPIAGVWADRVPKRSILILTDLGRLAALASLALAYALDALTLWHLFAAAAVVGMLTVFFDVSYQSFLPALVGPQNLVEANGKLEFTRSFADTGGFAAAGGLIAVLGSALAVLVDAVTFLVSAGFLLLMKHREPKREPAQAPTGGAASGSRVLAEMAEGLGLIRADRRLRGLMLATGAANLGMAIGNTMVLLYAYQEAALSPGVVGLAFAAGGAGLLTGAVSARRIADAVSLGGTLVSATCVSGVCFIVLGGAPLGFALPVLLVCQFLLGMGNSVYNIHVLSLVGGIVPGPLMGRVSGTALTVVHGCGALGGVLGGMVGSVASVRVGLLTGGVMVFLASGFVIFSPVWAMKEHPANEQPDPEPATLSGSGA